MKNRDGFTRRKEQSKEGIRKAAWELFSQFGVARVSIADIARQAGISQATIYNNFKDKDALAREFANAKIQDLVTQVENLFTPEMSYYTKVDVLITFLSQIWTRRNPVENEHLIFTSSAMLLQDPEVSRMRQAAYEKMVGILLKLVQEGRQSGNISAEFSDEAIALYFKAFMDLFSDPHNQKQFFNNPQMAQSLGKLMLFGLSGNSTPEF